MVCLVETRETRWNDSIGLDAGQCTGAESQIATRNDGWA